MIFDFFGLIVEVLEKFSQIMNFFGNTRSTLESVLSQVGSFNLSSSLTPVFGTIRYVAGNTVYVALIRTLQVGFFLMLAKALYQLLQIILNSFVIQKPLSIIKTFLKL